MKITEPQRPDLTRELIARAQTPAAHRAQRLHPNVSARSEPGPRAQVPGTGLPQHLAAIVQAVDARGWSWHRSRLHPCQAPSLRAS